MNFEYRTPKLNFIRQLEDIIRYSVFDINSHANIWLNLRFPAASRC